MHSFKITTHNRDELIDITKEVQEIVSKTWVECGICYVYNPHTTAAITINENADAAVKKDIITGLSHLDFESLPFTHNEGNSPSHLKSSIIGCSETLLVEKEIGRAHV